MDTLYLTSVVLQELSAIFSVGDVKQVYFSDRKTQNS